MTTDIKGLEQKIERVVREHLVAVHAEIQASVTAAMVRGLSKPAEVSRGASRAKMGTRRKSARRRTADEIGTLAERLYATLLLHPGEGMNVLAPLLGASAAELHRPMSALKRAGRVRSVGERSQTIYFPMVGDGEVG